MKKKLLGIFILLGISNFAFKNLISNQKDNTQIQFTRYSYCYNTSYTHTWNKRYYTDEYKYSVATVNDSSATYFAGKWSDHAKNWNEFTRKYSYFAFTNNSVLLLEYGNRIYEISTNKNNFWKRTDRIKKYISGQNTNIVFQINAGGSYAYEVSLTLELWYTTDGDIYFKWNFKLKGNDLAARISVHLPQIKYYI